MSEMHVTMTIPLPEGTITDALVGPSGNLTPLGWQTVLEAVTKPMPEAHATISEDQANE